MANPNNMLGYLEAKVEHLEQEMSTVNAKLDKVLDQLSTYRTVLRIMRTVGAAFLLLLTLKLGDLSDLIRRAFKGI